VLEHLDDELGRQLWQQRRSVIHTQFSCGGGSSGPGEESSEHVCVGDNFRGLLGAESLCGGDALAGCRTESGKGGVGYGWTRESARGARGAGLGGFVLDAVAPPSGMFRAVCVCVCVCFAFYGCVLCARARDHNCVCVCVA
jgi:hypothetical protein